jgi:hypothetical protein
MYVTDTASARPALFSIAQPKKARSGIPVIVNPKLTAVNAMHSSKHDVRQLLRHLHRLLLRKLRYPLLLRRLLIKSFSKGVH